MRVTMPDQIVLGLRLLADVTKRLEAKRFTVPLGGKPYFHLAFACANPETTTEFWHRCHAAAEAAAKLGWHV